MQRLTLAILLVVGMILGSASLTSASQPRLFLQEDPDAAQPSTPERSDEIPPPDPAAPPDQAAPRVGGPGSDQPWYNWRNDVSDGLQAIGMILYGRFWGVREEFLAQPSFEAELNMRRVMAGQALDKEVAFIKQLEAKGQAQIVKVQHRPKVVYADDENYVIIDSYLDQSYLVDARTREPVDGGPPDEPDVFNMAYHLHLQPDRVFPDIPGWRVVETQAVTFVN